MVIESRTGTSAPTPASARLTELAAIAAVTPGVSYGDVSTVIRRAGQAIVLTYHQDSAPSPVTGKVTAQSVERYEFFRNGHTVTLTLAGLARTTLTRGAELPIVCLVAVTTTLLSRHSKCSRAERIGKAVQDNATHIG